MAKKPPVIKATISENPAAPKPLSMGTRIRNGFLVLFGVCALCSVFATVYNRTPQGQAAIATRTAEVDVPTVAVNTLAEQEETEPTNTPRAASTPRPRPTSTGRVASSTTEEVPTQAPSPTVEQPTEVPPTDVPAPVPTDTPIPVPTNVPPTVAPEPTAPPPPEPTAPLPVAPGALVIVDVNKRDEWADITNTGGGGVDLGGWTLRSEKGSQDCYLGGAIAPGQRLRVYAQSGPDGFSCNFDGPIWNNSETDNAVLINPQGQEVSRYNS